MTNTERSLKYERMLISGNSARTFDLEGFNFPEFQLEGTDGAYRLANTGRKSDPGLT